MTACEKCRQELGKFDDMICQKCVTDAESELRVSEKILDKATIDYQDKINVVYIDIER